MLHGSDAEIYMYLPGVVVVLSHQNLIICLAAPSLKLDKRKLNTLYDGHLGWHHVSSPEVSEYCHWSSLHIMIEWQIRAKS